MTLNFSKLTLPLHEYSSCHVRVRNGEFVLYFYAAVAGGKWVTDRVGTASGLSSDLAAKLAEGTKIIRAAKRLVGVGSL